MADSHCPRGGLSWIFCNIPKQHDREILSPTGDFRPRTGHLRSLLAGTRWSRPIAHLNMIADHGGSPAPCGHGAGGAGSTRSSSAADYRPRSGPGRSSTWSSRTRFCAPISTAPRALRLFPIHTWWSRRSGARPHALDRRLRAAVARASTLLDKSAAPLA